MITDSTTIRQQMVLDQLKSIISQVCKLNALGDFQSGNKNVVNGMVSLMKAEAEWKYELAMLRGEQ